MYFSLYMNMADFCSDGHVHYGDITLGCRMGYVTMKTTYNYVLYFFVNSSTWFALALVDLKVTMVSHLINEFKFQQVIHDKRRVCASITILVDGFIVLVNKNPDICHNGGWAQFMERKHRPSIIIAANIQSLLCGAHYVTQVSLNYKLVYVTRLEKSQLPRTQKQDTLFTIKW